MKEPFCEKASPKSGKLSNLGFRAMLSVLFGTLIMTVGSAIVFSSTHQASYAMLTIAIGGILWLSALHDVEQAYKLMEEERASA